MSDGIERRVALNFIRYGNCWEDADILCDALQPAPGKRMLSICSAGDNVLALLAAGSEVVAVDLNATQLACLELRCAAFRTLDYERLLAFLGVHATDDRLQTYRRLAGEMTPSSREFWDAHPKLIDNGIILTGKLEAYFHQFRQWVLPLIHSRRTVAELLRSKSRQEREVFWRSTWNNRRWQILFRLFFSKAAMGRLGRDPEFLRYVEGSVADRILQRTHHALTVLPTHDNPYLDYIANGNFRQCLPRYLRAEYFETTRRGLDRLTIVQGPIDEVAQQNHGTGYDGMNLSDIFEYLDEASSQQLYGRLLNVARPGARLVYWNTLVPRSCPTCFFDQVHPLTDLARELFERDKAFFYNALHIDEVLDDPP